MQGTALNGAKTSGQTTNSPYDYLMRGEGVKVTKVHTVDGAGAQTDNIFTVTGCVSAIIWGEVTSKTNSTTCSTFYIDLYDGAAAVEITDNGGTDMSGCVVGDVLSKDAVATTAITKVSCAAGAVTDGTAGTLMLRMPCRLMQKTGQTTYIRACFTGDNNTSLQITWYVRYIPVTSNGSVSAV